ncbi:hypothetical protein [Marinifilum caeruleilacunae]|uniref:Uncharacterized protein n=1 Tax=Marinifilum caeruleilacunae TaxID=2499076 RepID=A0ABX1WYL9_9BACT|nr:hypothetical protein [Marinifilum caeruleilacunae]NOU61021.1 hypothetical protein [Marinifilum caeruleilacunae]
MMHNKLDKLFGQAGSVLGWLFIVLGFLFTNSGVSAAFILIGSFMAFSYSAVKIDTVRNRYKLYYAYFGFINIGKWKYLSNIDGIGGVSPIIKRWSFAKDSKAYQFKPENCFVVLFRNHPKRRIPFKKCKDLVEAKLEAQKLAQLLHLNLIH